MDSIISTVWFGKCLQVVNLGTSYAITNGDSILSSHFPTKRLAIARAIELQDEFFS